MGPGQDWENISSLMDRWMMVVGFYHLLGRAVEHPIHRALCRHRLSPLLGERLLEGSGPTALTMLGPRLAQGHDDLCDALGRCGRSGSGASAQRCAPGGSRCAGAIPPCVAPTFRAGPCPTAVLDGVACQVSVDGSLSAVFVRVRHGGLLWSLLPSVSDCSLFSMSWHTHRGWGRPSDRLGGAHRTPCPLLHARGGCMSRRVGVVSACGSRGSGHVRW